jgi:indole-3-glycerol phosphate synthase
MQVIEGIIREKKTEAEQINLDEITVRKAKNPKISLSEAINSPGISIIAEVKKASPSAGRIGFFDATELSKKYEAAGANAVSVLTEGRHFGGSLTDLLQVKDSIRIPVLRKDFIVDKRQIIESSAYGADAVLIIVSILGEKTREFIDYAHSMGLECLVEAHTKDEVGVALESGAKMIGVNNRDLRTLKIDLGVCERIIPLIGGRALAVAESGIKTRQDMIRMRECGADAVLVGTSIAGSESPTEKIRELMI